MSYLYLNAEVPYRRIAIEKGFDDELVDDKSKNYELLAVWAQLARSQVDSHDGEGGREVGRG